MLGNIAVAVAAVFGTYITASGNQRIKIPMQLEATAFIISTAAKAKEAVVARQTVEEALTKKVDETFSALKAKEVTVGDNKLTYENVTTAIKGKKAELAAAADDATKAARKAELDKAVAQGREFFKGAKAESDAYNAAKNAVSKARRSAFDKAAETAGSEAKTAKDALEKAVADKTTAVKGKVDELCKNEAVQTAFGKVKGLFDKVGKGKAAAWAAAIAAVVVGAITYFVKNNQKDAA